MLIINLLFSIIPVKDVHFVKCLLKTGKHLEEAKTSIEEIKEGSCPVEEKAEVLYLSVWCKLMTGKSDFEAELKELEELNGTWFIKTSILQKR